MTTKAKQQKSVSTICDKSTILQELINKTQELQLLNQKLTSCLAQPLASHCCVANYRDNCLILLLDNAIWITELRYPIPALLTQLREVHLPNLDTIQWIVQPGKANFPSAATLPLPLLSQNTKEILGHTAEHIKNPKLAAALKKLAL